MMNVLSLFDGISCGQMALQRAGIRVDNYYASEIDKYAMQITQKNYPETIQLGNVTDIDFASIEKIDLLIGGSPCQDLSIAKRDRKGLTGERSGLFWKYVDALKTLKPKHFLFENVASMKKFDRDIITKALGVEPILINSALVSAQQRKRLYWTNIPGIEQPEDKKIYLQDILENGCVDRLKAYCITATYSRVGNLRDYFDYKQRQIVFDAPHRIGELNGKTYQQNRVYAMNGKSVSLSSNGGGWGANTGLYYTEQGIRKLTPLECERLQTLPEGYTEGISDTQRYKCIGNGWTVDVIAHIFKNIEQISLEETA